MVRRGLFVTVLILVGLSIFGFVRIGLMVWSLFFLHPCPNTERLNIEHVRQYGDPIIAKIEAYFLEHGECPASLDFIYSDPSAIPVPDVADGEWHYTASTWVDTAVTPPVTHHGFSLSIGCPPNLYPAVHYSGHSNEWWIDF